MKSIVIKIKDLLDGFDNRLEIHLWFKNSQETETEEHIFHLIKDIYERHTVNIVFSGEIVDPLPSYVRDTEVCLTTSIKYFTGWKN